MADGLCSGERTLVYQDQQPERLLQQFAGDSSGKVAAQLAAHYRKPCTPCLKP